MKKRIKRNREKMSYRRQQRRYNICIKENCNIETEQICKDSVHKDDVKI